MRNLLGNVNYCKLTQKYLPAILELQEEVYNTLSNKEIFVCDNENFFKKLLEDSGYGIGAFFGEKLVGYGFLYFPGYNEDNLFFDVSDIFDKKIDIEKVGHLETFVVKEDFRGNGIQKILIFLLENYATRNNFEMLLATVSPYNIPSLNNFFRLDYKILKLKEKYGGKLRYILGKSLKYNNY